MSDSYERMGKPIIPDWWMGQLQEKLRDPELNYAELAREVSGVVGRKNPWGGDAITKFKQGKTRTWEMALGLSHVLGLLPPMFIARTETEAGRMYKVSQELESSTDLTLGQRAKMTAYDGAHVHLVETARGDQTRELSSKNEAGKRRARGGGTRRPPRVRS